MSLPRDLVLALPEGARRQVARASLQHWRALAAVPATWRGLFMAPGALHDMCPGLDATVPRLHDMVLESHGRPEMTADGRYVLCCVGVPQARDDYYPRRAVVHTSVRVHDVHHPELPPVAIEDVLHARPLADGCVELWYGGGSIMHWNPSRQKGRAYQSIRSLAVLADGSRYGIDYNTHDVLCLDDNTKLTTAPLARDLLGAGETLLLLTQYGAMPWVRRGKGAWIALNANYIDQTCLDATGHYVALAHRRQVELCDTATGARLWCAEYTGQCIGLALSPSGTLALHYWVNKSGGVILWHKGIQRRHLEDADAPLAWANGRFWFWFWNHIPANTRVLGSVPE